MTYHDREKRRAQRDQRIRRHMLSVANSARGDRFGGYVTARGVVEILQASITQDTAPDGDDHAADLIRDLVSAGLLVERDDRERVGDAFRLDTWSLRVTPEATALLAEHTAPHPLVADARIRK